MSRQHAPWLALSVFGAIGLAPFAIAGDPSPRPTPAASTTSRPENVVLQALLTNPITAPYRISTKPRGGQVVLSGRVGTKLIHDTALRVAMATGYPIRDDLTIDTAETYRVAASGMGGGGFPAVPAVGVSPPYVYPPPLFGRIDDPFFGFEPPLVSYAPWWRSLSGREPISLPPPNGAGPTAGQPAIPYATNPGASSPIAIPLGPNPRDGTIEMTLDQQGVATLRGTVGSLADRVAIGQKIAQTPGIAQVINLLKVGSIASETPPPPPQPAEIPAVRPPAAPREAEPQDLPTPAPVAVDRGDLAGRVAQALTKRPALAGVPIKVTTRDSVVYLTGQVPTVYEAMLAFRAAQQTPGVRDIDDRLKFVVPDGERKNPLLQKGRPEDVEPYLAAQIRRQVGDLAHIDQVRLQGENLEIRGTIRRQDDRPRLDAILRSMPVLRGFRFATEVAVEE
jgi:hypothetical protein